MTEKNGEDLEQISKLINVGSEITGGVAGAMIGLLVAGLPGAIAGGGTAPLVTQFLQGIGQEIKNRVLSHREEVRVGATLTFAIQKIQENLNNGQRIRQDEFFKERLQERATADEIVEGVLLAAQREHEEKKLKFYGNLVANIAFHSEISKEQANLLIKLGATISFVQMCILNLTVNKASFKLREQDHVLKDKDGQVYSSLLCLKEISTLQEVYDLYLKRLLDFEIDGVILGKPIGDLEYIKPQTLKLKTIGLQLHNLMELHEISQRDIEPVAQVLSKRTS